MEPSSTRVPTSLTDLHRDAWGSLLEFLGASELANLCATHDKSLLARLFSSRSVTKLILLADDLENASLELRELLYNLTSLEKLELAFSTSLYGNTPALVLSLRKLLPRISLKELTMFGRINTHSNAEQGLFTAANLCPALETLKFPLEPIFPSKQQAEAFSSRLPPTLTCYTGPTAYDSFSSSEALFPPTMTELNLSTTIAAPYQLGFNTILATLSSLRLLSVMRLYLSAGGTHDHPPTDSAPLHFPCLTELLIAAKYWPSALPPLHAPLLLTYIVSCTENPVGLLSVLPATLTHLTIKYSSLLPPSLLNNLPTGLRILRLFQANVGGALGEWFPHFPSGLEELVASPPYIDLNALPPRLERLIYREHRISDFDLACSFSELSSRAIAPTSFGHMVPVLRVPLPQSLTTIIGLPISFEFLPKSLQTLSVPPLSIIQANDLERLIQHFPSLTFLRLSHPVALPQPWRTFTTLSTLTYPHHVMTEKFSSLAPNGLNIKWYFPDTAFLLPTTLETLILHQIPFDVTLNDEDPIENCLLHPRSLDGLMKDNLSRLPCLTHLDICGPHKEPLAPHLSFLPNLIFLADSARLASFPLSALPRGLKTLVLAFNRLKYDFSAPPQASNTPAGKFVSSPTAPAPSSAFGRLPSFGTAPAFGTQKSSTFATQSSSNGFGGASSGFGQHSSATPLPAWPGGVTTPSTFSDPNRSSYSKLEFNWSDLPTSLTEIDFQGSFKTKLGTSLLSFATSSIKHWPKGLTSLSIAVDRSWSGADALALKSHLPSLKHACLTGPLCVAALPTDTSFDPSSIEFEGLALNPPAQDLGDQDITAESLKLLIRSQFRRHGIKLTDFTIDLAAIASLPPETDCQHQHWN